MKFVVPFSVFFPTLLIRMHHFLRRSARHFPLLALLAAGACFLAIEAAEPVPPFGALTTVILVRHGEKEIVAPDNKDPDLSPAGIVRTRELQRMLGPAGVAAIYASHLKRTQQTVRPLAEKLGLTVTIVDVRETVELVRQIRTRNGGQTILVAGHNNTVPEIIAALGGPHLPDIPETEYDNLFVLTVQPDGTAKLLGLKYGTSPPAPGKD